MTATATSAPNIGSVSNIGDKSTVFAGVNVDDGSTIFAGVNIEGDVHVGGAKEQNFSSVSLDLYHEPAFPPPRNIDQLVAALRQESILVLHGERSGLMTQLAFHLAWRLQQALAAGAASPQAKPAVLRWRPNPDILGLELKLRETTDPTIFLLPNLATNDIAALSLKQLKAHTSSRHYVIISTDGGAGWQKLGQQSPQYWCSLQVPGLFEPASLCAALVAQLTEAAGKLPPGRLPATIDANTVIADGQTVRDVAWQLIEPRELRELTRRLYMAWEQWGQLPSGLLQKLVDVVKREFADNPEERLRDRYNRLGQRIQLLALNLSFFANLYEDQCFGAIERMVKHVWRPRDPLLRAFDYHEAEKLREFFSFEDTGDSSGQRIVHAQVRNQRQILLRLAWEKQRRQIIAALPMLINIVRQSVRPYDDLDLYRDDSQREQMRLVIGETLSDIGLIDNDVVRMTLLELAADNELDVQAVAANAITRWRYFGRHQEVFNMLQEWWHMAVEFRLRETIQAILEQRNVRTENTPDSYVRATVALALGYAAQYDPPNQLADPLVKLLVTVSQDTDKFVLDRFATWTLPNVVPRHHVQLRDVLREMTERHLEEAIARSLAEAYRLNPVEVTATLNSWWHEAAAISPSGVHGKGALREALLATVAYTLGEISYSDTSAIKVRSAFEWLWKILRKERHQDVRTAAVTAIMRIARKEFAGVERFVQHALATANDDERTRVVEGLRIIYIDQLKSMKGDSSIFVNSHIGSLPIWLPPSKPPQTEVERALLRWMKDPRNPIAEQTAVRAMALIEPIKQFVDRHTNAIAEKRKKEAEERAKAATLAAPTFTAARARDWYLDYIVPLLATVGAWRYAPIISNVLPEALARNPDLTTRKHVISFLARWVHLNDRELLTIGRRLRVALWLGDHGRLVMGLLVILMCVVGYSLFQIALMVTQG